MKRSIHFSKCIMVLIALLTLSTNSTLAQTQQMTISPDNLVLNAQGNFTNILCKYGGVIQSGYYISGHSVVMYMDNTVVSISAAVTYCPIDNIIFVEFNRADLQNNPVVIALANTGIVEVNILGFFTATNGQGQVITYNVDRVGYMTIKAPGKNF